MSSFNRRFILALPLALGACGFTPAYGPGSAGSTMLGRVWVEDPKTKADFDFVERMEERLGRPQAPLYRLEYENSVSEAAVGVTADQRITRYHVIGVTQYRLLAQDSRKVLAEGRVQSFTSYAATGSTVAGLAAEEDAYQRLMRILADQIVTQLIAQMSKYTPEPKVP